MIRLINLLWLLPLFTLIRPAIGQEKMPIDPNIKMGKLDNGLVYYIRKNTKNSNDHLAKLKRIGSNFSTKLMRNGKKLSLLKPN